MVKAAVTEEGPGTLTVFNNSVILARGELGEYNKS
jgi:hypothetical protein